MIDISEIWLHIILDMLSLKGRNTKIKIIFQFCKNIFLCGIQRVGAFVNKNAGNRFLLSYVIISFSDI